MVLWYFEDVSFAIVTQISNQMRNMKGIVGLAIFFVVVLANVDCRNYNELSGTKPDHNGPGAYLDIMDFKEWLFNRFHAKESDLATENAKTKIYGDHSFNNKADFIGYKKDILDSRAVTKISGKKRNEFEKMPSFINIYDEWFRNKLRRYILDSDTGTVEKITDKNKGEEDNEGNEHNVFLDEEYPERLQNTLNRGRRHDYRANTLEKRKKDESQMTISNKDGISTGPLLNRPARSYPDPATLQVRYDPEKGIQYVYGTNDDDYEWGDDDDDEYETDEYDDYVPPDATDYGKPYKVCKKFPERDGGDKYPCTIMRQRTRIKPDGKNIFTNTWKRFREAFPEKFGRNFGFFETVPDDADYPWLNYNIASFT